MSKTQGNELAVRSEAEEVTRTRSEIHSLSSQEQTSVVMPTLDIPARYRGPVYLIGMIGFPVVVALFVLVTLSADLKEVNKSVANLATRIDERPLGLEKSTDLVIYICDGLRADLQAAFPALVRELDFSVDSSSMEAYARRLSILDREVSGLIRPIVRKHQRFASRFPTVGGNLASFFAVSSPSENIRAGQTEAGLVGQTSQDVGEALRALVMNNIAQFGDLPASVRGPLQAGTSEVAEEQLMVDFFALMAQGLREKGLGENGEAVDSQTIIDPEPFLALALDAVDTTATVLQDQMLTHLRVNSSEVEQ